ncbi:hypothetical protein [Apilactobacillus xinyiensis]|uniref:hypothetical protein n=1 Tax=Apilactobacillus xinyiensis TaxID=2841032 RepID=UPI001C7E0AF9|nr:hypothetical protein [Apilactobacillus xinyiensis]
MEIIAALMAIIGLYITYSFNRNNNELNALHGESHWRENLTNISKKSLIRIEELELFRTCLSATRGFDNFNLDYRETKKDCDLDDYCICYYHYLLDKYLLKSSNIQYSSNKFSDTVIFRQLCRLLLKSDWNIRISQSLSFKMFHLNHKDEPREKARNILLANTDFVKFIDYNKLMYVFKKPKVNNSYIRILTNCIYFLLFISVYSYACFHVYRSNGIHYKDFYFSSLIFLSLLIIDYTCNFLGKFLPDRLKIFLNIAVIITALITAIFLTSFFFLYIYKVC